MRFRAEAMSPLTPALHRFPSTQPSSLRPNRYAEGPSEEPYELARLLAGGRTSLVASALAELDFDEVCRGRLNCQDAISGLVFFWCARAVGPVNVLRWPRRSPSSALTRCAAAIFWQEPKEMTPLGCVFFGEGGWCLWRLLNGGRMPCLAECIRIAVAGRQLARWLVLASRFLLALRRAQL